MSTTIPRRVLEYWPKLSPQQYEGARNHLREAGYDVDRIQPLIWPDDAVAAHQEHAYAPWTFTTKADVRARKIKKMKRNLQLKRDDGVTQRRALYVWVFWYPGISGFIFRGWWTYFKGSGQQSYYGSGGSKGDVGKYMTEIMELFPVKNPHPLYPMEPHEWMPRFARRYQRGKSCGKPQGKAAIWAEVDGGYVKKIINKVDWPE